MTKPTTPLRQRMIEEMAIRNMSPLTQAAYVRAVAADTVVEHGPAGLSRRMITDRIYLRTDGPQSNVAAGRRFRAGHIIAM